MTAYIPSPEFSRACMLVSLNIKSYTGRKEDKAASKKVKKDAGASDDSGAFMKNLVPKDSLDPIVKAVGALRSFHYENTLPWLDEGVRVLATQNYVEYKTQYESLRDAYDTAVRDFALAWPAIVAEAQRTRGALFDPADYPADISSRFGLKLNFQPLADTSDFRVNLTEGEVALLRSQIEGSYQEGQRVAMDSLYAKLAASVKAMADKLRAYTPANGDDKATGVFRDSLVENLREQVALIPRMNFANDPELEAVRALVESQLCAHDASELRDSDAARAKVAESAEAIAERLGEFMRESAS